MSDVQAVEFRAEIRQVKTMADRTINVILNLPEDCLPQAQKIMEWLGLEAQTLIVAPGNALDGKKTGRGKRGSKD